MIHCTDLGVKRHGRRFAAAILVSLMAPAILPQAAHAQMPPLQPAPPADKFAALDAADREAEAKAVWQEIGRVAQVGPRQIALLDQGTLNLPAGQVFVPASTANRLMAVLGNRTLDSRFGLILPANGKDNWIIDIVWAKEGYVKDGDAKEWEPDALLESLKAGTEEDNKGRQARGMPALDITGWVQQPVYDGARHQLVWSIAAHDRGTSDGGPETINYNTYALGREGFFTLNLLTDSTAVAADKSAVQSDLAGLSFNPGKRYEDFDSSTDKVAAFGLAGLIGAVAIKKMGLLAVIGVFLLKIWKLVLFVVLGGWAALRRRIARLFGRKEDEDPFAEYVTAEPDPSEPAAPEGAVAPDPEPAVVLTKSPEEARPVA